MSQQRSEVRDKDHVTLVNGDRHCGEADFGCHPPTPGETAKSFERAHSLWSEKPHLAAPSYRPFVRHAIRSDEVRCCRSSRSADQVNDEATEAQPRFACAILAQIVDLHSLFKASTGSTRAACR